MFRFKKSAYRSDPDVMLMLEVKAGNKSAFNTLMDRYYARVLNFIYRFTGDRGIAEDMCQEVFLRVYRHAPGYRPRSKFQTWLYTIAKNLSLNELRKTTRLQMDSIDAANFSDGQDTFRKNENPSGLQPEVELIRRQRQAMIRTAVLGLPPKQRMAVILRRYEDLSYAEIAVILEVSEKAVKSLLNRAKETLKQRLTGVLESY